MSAQLDTLLQLMSRLRSKENGCSWSLEQTFESIVPYTLEEAYEVADAIEKSDFEGLRSELGDLLFQVIFYSQLAKEKNWYNFDDIAQSLIDKLEQRNPILQNPDLKLSSTESHSIWEETKSQSKLTDSDSELLDDIPANLPALTRAQKLQTKAASVGFDWDNIQDVMPKLQEELSELQEALANNDIDHSREELGDLLFSCVNLSRHLNSDAEQLLRFANQKFSTRFKKMAELSDKPLKSLNPDELDILWQQTKS